MVRSAESHRQAAQRAWQLIFDVFMQSYPARLEALGRRGLTPNDSRALFSLDRKVGHPIGALAKRWDCDPSTATWVVDRLEKAGLAERRPSPDDRRVKLVRLTARGEKTKAAIITDFYAAIPQALEGLSSADLAALTGLLERVVASGGNYFDLSK